VNPRPNFWLLERLMERIEVLDEEEWLIALQSGGGKWLNDSGGGLIAKIEKIKVGESPDGQPIYKERGLIGVGDPGEAPDFSAAPPTIYREGDRIRVVTEKPPAGLQLP
jgi:hypothetical protein